MDTMARPFIIKRETLPITPYLMDASFEPAPEYRLGMRNGCSSQPDHVRLISWAHGIGPERMLDVGNDQFLVLLFMVQPQFDQAQNFG